MPYIKQADRFDIFDDRILSLGMAIRCPGDFNYIISRLFTLQIDKHGKSYHELSRWLAAVKDAGVEIDRRVVGPYEDECIEKNGDVFDDIL